MTNAPIVPHLLDRCDEAVLASEGLLVAAKDSVAALVTVDGKISAKAMDREQRAAHGLAWLATYVTPEIKQRGGSWDNIPDLKFLPPTNDAAEDPKAWFQDPGNYFWRSAMDHIEHSTGHENAVQLDTEYMLDNSWLDSLKVGARYADRDQEVRYTTYNWGVLSEIWNGSTGPVWLGQNSYSANCTDFSTPPGNPGCGNNYITGNVVPGQRVGPGTPRGRPQDQRDDDRVVRVTEHRDEVWNQVDRQGEIHQQQRKTNPDAAGRVGIGGQPLDQAYQVGQQPQGFLQVIFAGSGQI